MKITITLLTVLLFGILDGTRDTLLFHYDESVFAKLENQQFVNPEISWKNKYKDVDSGYYREKFLGSTTVFSFTTDLWHLLKFCQYNMILILIFAYTVHKRKYKWYWNLSLFIGINTIFSLGFHLMWSIIL